LYYDLILVPLIFIILVKYSKLELLFKHIINTVSDNKLRHMEYYVKSRFCKKQNMFFTFKYLYKLKGSVRYKSTVAPLSNNFNKYRLTDLMNEHIKKGNPTTSEIINNVLLNQKVSISQEELNKLLNLSKVKFDLPIRRKLILHYWH